jgi:AhpC/TSA family protein
MLVAMGGFPRLLAVAGIALVSASIVACRDASPPASDSRNREAGTRPQAVQLRVGDPAPEFSLPGSDGKVYSLAAYRGKQAVVLAWFVKAFTGP